MYKRQAFIHNAAGYRLYQTAKKLPIADYHCHLSPREIWEDRPFENPAQLWLAGDHYKWRLMRTFGVQESFITGGADGLQKFKKYAECLSLAAGSPLYHLSLIHISTAITKKRAGTQHIKPAGENLSLYL